MAVWRHRQEGYRVGERSACVGRTKEGTFFPCFLATQYNQSLHCTATKRRRLTPIIIIITHQPTNQRRLTLGSNASIMIDFCSFLYHFDFGQWWDREDVHCHSHVNSGTCSDNWECRDSVKIKEKKQGGGGTVLWKGTLHGLWCHLLFPSSIAVPSTRWDGNV